ncbi:MAG: NYN domain-containing protein [Desulfovibrio sp.]|jgi:hypothetical protein|nr:NYN domain-containing protein [Desulfovibrio sp.]
MPPSTTQERPACAAPPPGDDAQRKLAVLIDADNAQPAITPALLAEISRFGVACVRRIYGDWTRPELSGWKDMLHAHSLLPIQQFQYTNGKNSTDCALIIDAMDLMHTGRFDGFCLVSSDSDFTRLAARLREEGLVVYGFGEQKTPEAFVRACTRFIYTELLRPGALRPTVPASAAPAAAKTPPRAAARQVPDPPPRTRQKAVAVPAKAPQPGKQKQKPVPVGLIELAVEATSDDNGWAALSSVANNILQMQPQFDSRMYGHAKFGGLVRALSDFFELAERATPRGGITQYIRNRNGG